KPEWPARAPVPHPIRMQPPAELELGDPRAPPPATRFRVAIPASGGHDAHKDFDFQRRRRHPWR
ncbi:MAG TPA: hypothetical protein PKM22_13055, partial [Candidatus Hydrogenedentes bacterium]|nr:hypothetical protein [Candidatus Hydrogenedentota bacterium]